VARRAKHQGAAAQAKQKKRGASRIRNRKIDPPRKRAMPVKRRTVRSKSSRTSKVQGRLDDRKITASAGGAARELIWADMKKMKAAPGASREFSGNGEVRKPGATKRLASAPVFKHPKTELEAAVQRYVDLFDFAPIAYITFNRVGRVEEINLAAAQLLGRSRDRLIGEPFAPHVMKEDSALFLNHLLRCRSTDTRVETEMHLRKRSGDIILAHLASSPITSSMRDGALLYQTAIMDLGEREAAEAKLRASEERYRTLFNLGPVAIYSIDTSGRIENFNRRAAELWGREPALGDTDQRFCGSFKMFRPDGSFMPHEQCPMAEVLSGKITEARDAEVLIERPDGSRVTVLVNIRPLKNDRGEVTGAINCFYDITARKRAEAALEKSKNLLEQRVHERTRELRGANDELEAEIARRKGLEGEILEISDREQQRLGQELHDGLCQHLTAVAFMARSVALRLKNHRVIEVGDIEKIAQLVNEAATDTRDLSRALHRIDVDAVGLVNALQDLVDREIWKIPCRLEVEPSFHIEDDVAAAELYRIAREAVINANKHAQARKIVITLGSWQKGIVLSIADDGVGFQSELNSARGGLGLPIMKYRARSIGGRLEIESPKERGTRVACYLPDGPLQSRKKGNARPGRFSAKITKH
jgi:PAS domain S-box-containing protein